MTRTRIAIVVVGVAILFFFAFILVLFRPPPAITVRQIKSVQYRQVTALTFGITNPASRAFMIVPASVDVLRGTVWTACFDFDTNRTRDVVGPHSFMSFTLEATNLPTVSPLRLRMLAQQEIVGLDKLRTKLFLRFVPLPFGSSGPWFELHQVPIMSDQFVESEPAQEGQGGSQK